MSGPLQNVLILDTETGGIDPTVHPCIEVACILYSVEHATPLEAYASLLRSPTNDAAAVNGIPIAALADAPEPVTVWRRVWSMANASDAFVAHNADFDRGFVHAKVRDAKPWICSCYDLAWPRAQRLGANLVALALAHGLGVAHAHRAMADCELISRLLSRVAETGTDLQAFLSRGLREKGLFVVAERGFDEARNAIAKEHGFRWDAGARDWRRTMAVEDVAGLPFVVARVQA